MACPVSWCVSYDVSWHLSFCLCNVIVQSEQGLHSALEDYDVQMPHCRCVYQPAVAVPRAGKKQLSLRRRNLSSSVQLMQRIVTLCMNILFMIMFYLCSL